jgi:GH25 family lysozyme M1 (1,4-beta-N-acetylmuramidase)
MNNTRTGARGQETRTQERRRGRSFASALLSVSLSCLLIVSLSATGVAYADPGTDASAHASAAASNGVSLGEPGTADSGGTGGEGDAGTGTGGSGDTAGEGTGDAPGEGDDGGTTPGGEGTGNPDGSDADDPASDASDPSDLEADPADDAQFSEDEATPSDESMELSLLAAADLSGAYTIASTLPGSKVLDIPSASRENGAYVQIYTPNTTLAQRFKLTRQNDGSYTIVNIASGKALDVRWGQAASGAAVWQYALNNTAAQRWEIISTGDADNSYYLRSKLDKNLYLDIYHGSSANGTRLQIYQGNATPAQKFFLNKVERSIADGYYIIHTKSSDKVLDVAGGGLASGSNLQIYQSNNTFAQKFAVTFDADTGYYTITNVNAMKPLDVAGARAANGTNVAIYAANNTSAQRWTITGDGQGAYRIYAACSGLVLDVQRASSANGTNVQTYAANNTLAQAWTFETTVLVADKSIVTFQSALGTVLDVASGGVADGTNIQAYTANGTQAQKFRVTAVGGGYYQIECLNSGKVLSLSGDNVVLSASVNAGTQRWKPVSAGVGGNYLFWENGNGKVLDIVWGDASAGANVQVYKLNETPAQRWRLSSTPVIGEGIYALASALDANMVLAIEGDSRSDGAVPRLYRADGGFAQKLSFIRNSDGSYRIIPLGSSKPLEVKDGAIDSASGQGAVQQWTWRTTDAARQNWRVEYVDNGQYRMISRVGDGSSCLTVKDGAAAEGTEILVARQTNGSNAQLFRFTGFVSVGSYVNAPLDGIDVSSWQPADIGDRVNYDFMIVKATGGATYTNPYYTTQANSALARGKKLGFYHFAQDDGGQNSATAEAWHFVNSIRAYVGRATLFLDYERDLPGDDRAWITAFCNEVYRLTGVKCGIYTSGSWALNNINGLWDDLGVPLWQANYPYSRDHLSYTHEYTPMVPCDIHQYTSRGRLFGYNDYLDFNVSFGSTAAWDYWAARR